MITQNFEEQMGDMISLMKSEKQWKTEKSERMILFYERN